MSAVRIRPVESEDRAAVRDIETRAFGRTDEAELVDRLRADGDVVVELIAEQDGVAVGHILFSRLAVDPAARFAALAPVAVSPTHQRGGVGGALVRAGLDACRDAGQVAVIVLGHPEYYPRFGFSTEAALQVRSPFEGPAFMALALRSGALDRPVAITYAAAFGL